MFCENCGEQLENTKFCGHCGSINGENEVQLATVKINTVKKAKSKNVIFIIVAVVFIIIIISVTIIAVSPDAGSLKPSGTYLAKPELFGFTVAEMAITFNSDNFNLEISSFGFSLDYDELNGSYKIEENKIRFKFESGLIVDGSFDIENNQITVIYVNFYDLGKFKFLKQ